MYLFLIFQADFEEFNEVAEISLSVMFSFKGMPDVFNEVDDPKVIKLEQVLNI